MIFGKNDVVAISREVELQGATSADVRLEMQAGELKLRGGARGLLDATFECNKELTPEIDHTVNAGRAELCVRQQERRHSKRSTRNEWDIALNSAIPTALHVEHRAGKSTLDISRLQLKRLAMRCSAGTTTLRAGGEQPELSALEIDATAGALDLSLRGTYAQLRSLQVNTKTGAVALDLRGHFRSALEGRVTAATGAVTVKLPPDVGVAVEAHTTVGMVDARGLTWDGAVYRNALYGTAPVTLRLTVSASVGKISLEAEG